MEHEPSPLDIALAAREMGIVAVPCHPGTKIPRVRWKIYQTVMPGEDEQRAWFSTPCNVAIITTGMLVFDCDDPAKVELVVEECGETGHVLKTPRGGQHLGYRRRKGVQIGNKVKIKGMDVDIRTDGGIEMIPPSQTPDGRYEWIGEGLRPLAELPFGNIAWTRDRRRRRVKGVLTHPEFPPALQGNVRNPESYCRRIFSVQGQNGSKKLVRVVCVLRDAGRSAADAWTYLLAWNETNAVPPWSEGELRHALERHYGIN